MDTVTIKILKGSFFHSDGKVYGPGCPLGALIQNFPRDKAELHAKTGACIIVEAKAPSAKSEMPIGATGQPQVTRKGPRGNRK